MLNLIVCFNFAEIFIADGCNVFGYQLYKINNYSSQVLISFVFYNNIIICNRNQFFTIILPLLINAPVS